MKDRDSKEISSSSHRYEKSLWSIFFIIISKYNSIPLTIFCFHNRDMGFMLILIFDSIYISVLDIMTMNNYSRHGTTTLQTSAADPKLHLCVVYKLFHTFFSGTTSIGPPQ